MYFHKLKGLWDEYAILEPIFTCVCGSHKFQLERDQKKKLLQFLMRLHESNATVKGQILMMNPLPTLSQAFAFVKQDERSRHSYNTVSSPLANSTVANVEGSSALVSSKRFV